MNIERRVDYNKILLLCMSIVSLVFSISPKVWLGLSIDRTFLFTTEEEYNKALNDELAFRIVAGFFACTCFPSMGLALSMTVPRAIRRLFPQNEGTIERFLPPETFIASAFYAGLLGVAAQILGTLSCYLWDDGTRYLQTARFEAFNFVEGTAALLILMVVLSTIFCGLFLCVVILRMAIKRVIQEVLVDNIEQGDEPSRQKLKKVAVERGIGSSIVD